ncbi:hypothetical protein HIM_06032 [Hirsutella minnesotensis 3608]|uniref:Uncharacterized protein n=1 Tax=Hirsutella minnesotensis 3608 TaxID=1043627 RepID=A0A0F7ZZR5_9HYPO|nr:hypothetical protein HIM_06032 [Hirsutella minnesotensis 3608]
MNEVGGSSPRPPRPMSMPEQARTVRAQLEERFRETGQRYQQIEPMVDEQVKRVCRDYQPPLWTRLRLSRDGVLLHTKVLIAAIAMTTNQELSDSAAQAVAESYSSSLQLRQSYTWLAIGTSAALAYRGRKIFRFPFYTPKVQGRFDPSKLHPRTARLLHAARFLAYYIVSAAGIYPLADYVTAKHFEASIRQDSRLDMFSTLDPRGMAELGRNKDFIMVHELSNRRRPQDLQRRDAGIDAPYEPAISQENSVSSQAQAAWTKHYAKQQPQDSFGASQQITAQDGRWDDFADQDDDASPLAASARSEQRGVSGQGGGSAWDRLRRQNSVETTRQPQRTNEAWPSTQGEGDWNGRNNAGAGASGSSDGYSFSTSGQDRAFDKDQAQREFDELLERERRGTDQGSTWKK